MGQDDEHATGGPPPPPTFARRVPGSHLWVLALFAIIPALAVMGLLGSEPHTQTTKAEREGLVLAVTCAGRVRYGHATKVTVRVRAFDGRPLEDLRVRIDSAFLERFDDISATPEAVAIAAGGYEFSPAPGATEMAIAIDLVPERCGWAGGRVALVTPNGSVAELPIRLFVLP